MRGGEAELYPGEGDSSICRLKRNIKSEKKVF